LTVIAYRDGILAADSLLTFGGTRGGYARKIMRHGSLLIGFCGKSTNFEAFRNWVAAGMVGTFKSDDGNVFIIPPAGPAIVWGTGETPWRETAPYWALGDGDEIALGAMAAGASAPEAVRIAIEHKTSCGGEVVILNRQEV